MPQEFSFPTEEAVTVVWSSSAPITMSADSTIVCVQIFPSSAPIILLPDSTFVYNPVSEYVQQPHSHFLVGTTIIQIGPSRISAWTTTTRPTSPKTGTFGFNTTTGALEYWNGAVWKTVAMT